MRSARRWATRTRTEPRGPGGYAARIRPIAVHHIEPFCPVKFRPGGCHQPLPVRRPGRRPSGKPGPFRQVDCDGAVRGKDEERRWIVVVARDPTDSQPTAVGRPVWGLFVARETVQLANVRPICVRGVEVGRIPSSDGEEGELPPAKFGKDARRGSVRARLCVRGAPALVRGWAVD
jgi:hypothetical protein